MRKIRNSFSTKLSLNILFITSIMFLVAIAIISISSHMLIAEEATKSATNILKASICDIEKHLTSVEIPVNDATWIVKDKRHDKKAMYEITDLLVRKHPYIIGSAIAFVPYYFDGDYYFSPYSYIDSAGTIKSKQLGNEAYDYFSMDWYKTAYERGEEYWSEPYYDEGGGEALMATYSLPVRDEDGKIFAIITSDISLDWLSEKAAAIHPYISSYMAIVSRDGLCVASTRDAEMRGKNMFQSEIISNNPKLVGIRDCMLSGRDSVMRFTLGKEVSFAVFGPISNGWSASIVCRYREVLERSSKMNLILIMVGIFGLLVLFVLCYRIVAKLTKPLTDFSDSARKIASGDFSTKLPEISSEDEIGELRDSFEFMQSSLTKYIEDLKTSTAQNERFESELSIAREIQLSMVPAESPYNGLVDIFGILRPAKEVGGDLYDFNLFKNNSLYFAVGDVSGKGVPAALIMSTMRSFLRSSIGQKLSVNHHVERFNDVLCENNSRNMFVTLFAAKFDLSTREMQFCNAGHCPIIIAEPGKDAYYLQADSNIAVGVLPNFEYSLQSVILPEGTRIILYTDGVTEAEKADKSQYGCRKLLDFVNSLDPGLDMQQTSKAILSDVNKFTDGNEQNDDITLLAIRV